MIKKLKQIFSRKPKAKVQPVVRRLNEQVVYHNTVVCDNSSDILTNAIIVSSLLDNRHPIVEIREDCNSSSEIPRSTIEDSAPAYSESSNSDYSSSGCGSYDSGSCDCGGGSDSSY